MIEQTENLIVEILRKLQADVADLKTGQDSMQTCLGLVEHSLVDLYTAYADQGTRIDRIERRLGRIEHRLELRDRP